MRSQSGLFVDINEAFDTNFTETKGTFDLVDGVISGDLVNEVPETRVSSGAVENRNRTEGEVRQRTMGVLTPKCTKLRL